MNKLSFKLAAALAISAALVACSDDDNDRNSPSPASSSSMMSSAQPSSSEMTSISVSSASSDSSMSSMMSSSSSALINSSMSSSSEPSVTCDPLAVSNGKDLYNSAACFACHGSVDEQAGTVPGSALGPMFDVNNYLITNSDSLDTYIATQMMNGRQGCAGDAICEMQASEIATYLKSLSTEKCPLPSMEFEAVIADFADYKDWPVVDYTIGDASQGLKSAHNADSDQYLRKTFANGAAQNSTTAEFDLGAIFIKETFTYERENNEWHKAFAEQGGLLAMVKRGGDFNSDHNGWEWFMLSSDLSEVITQGADLMDGACNACHSQAEMLGGTDYSFPKPTEFTIDTSVFANYTNWDMVEFTTEDIANLGSAHQNNTDTPPLRRIFQKQILANPSETESLGYPVGTVIVKDVLVDNEIKEVVAMVKRGGEFAPATGNWEWFMLDINDPSQVAEVNGNSMRGDLAMCTGCHGKAEDDVGSDYVFSHTFAPFNAHTTGEFIATKADLTSYTQWPVTDYALGNSNPFLGGAHASGTEAHSRQVFENGIALMQTGTDAYMPGSIIAKEVFTTVDGEKSFAGVFAMIKRGGTFNPDHGAWEWVILDGESNVLERGSDLKGGACNGCHEKAMDTAGVDYTFNKPSTITVNEDAVKAMIADYQQWTLVQEATGAPAANVGGHATGSNIVRKTYKKQPAANPYVEADQYPVGTVYVKEIVNDGVVGTIYGMVKSSTEWTWFTTNAAMSSVTLYNGAPCSDCHGLAGDPDRIATDSSYLGKDFVFYKEHDPVPMPVPMP